MNKSDSALERVHTLYLLQAKLISSLVADMSNPNARKAIKQDMREFEQLLKKADWRYMGGEDVLESLKTLPREIHQKLRAKSSVRERTQKRMSKSKSSKKTKVSKKKVKKASKPKKSKKVKKSKAKRRK